MKKIIYFFILVISSLHAQITIHYDSINVQQTLRRTAVDLSYLLGEATGMTYHVRWDSTDATTGVLLTIDESITSYRAHQGRAQGNGTNRLRFTSFTMDGVEYAVYQWLDEIGFKFYAPDENYTIVPTLASPFVVIDKIYVTNYSYHGWFGSGYIAPTALDSENTIIKDWELYQHRNNMKNEYTFGGHNETFHHVDSAFLVNNECYIAERDSSRNLYVNSVADPLLPAARQRWADYLFRLDSQYVASYNLNPNYHFLKGIETPDGSRWGNTNSNTLCEPGASGSEYPTASTQAFMLANHVTEYYSTRISEPFRTIMYAYGEANDTPAVEVNPLIDVMIVGAFGTVNSYVELMNRWTEKHPSTFEYDYINLPDQTYQTPYLKLDYYDAKHKRMNPSNSRGTFYESTFSKFASIPYLYAIQEYMEDSTEIITSMNEYYNLMYGSAASKIKELYDHWTSDVASTHGNFLADNFSRIPLYLKLVKEADDLNSDPLIAKRITDLKAYLHYLVLMNESEFRYKDSVEQYNARYETCMYLLKTAYRKIANHYQQINVIVSKPSQSSALVPLFFTPVSGGYTTTTLWNQTQYSDAQINTIFEQDLLDYPLYDDYHFANIIDIINQIDVLGYRPKQMIHQQLPETYSPSLGYSHIYAPAAGNIKVYYKIEFDSSGSKPILITLENKNQLYADAQTIYYANGDTGEITLTIPTAGYYVLLYTTPSHMKVNYHFQTNDNLFYKQDGITVDFANIYLDKASAARYFYVPEGTAKIWLTSNNACGLYGCLDTLMLRFSVNFFNSDSIAPPIYYSGFDSSLFYIEVPDSMDGKFWQMYDRSITGYAISFANISNAYFHLEPGNDWDYMSIENETISAAIYPVPASNYMTIECAERSPKTYTIFTLQGKIVDTWQDDLPITLKNIAHLSDGIYFLRIQSGNKLVTKKFIVAK